MAWIKVNEIDNDVAYVNLKDVTSIRFREDKPVIASVIEVIERQQQTTEEDNNWILYINEDLEYEITESEATRLSSRLDLSFDLE